MKLCNPLKVIAPAIVLLTVSSIGLSQTPALTVPDGLAVNIKHAGMAAKDMDRLADAGFRIVRFDLAWSSVEKKAGVYDFIKNGQNYDALVDEMGKRNVRVLFILAYGNSLYCRKDAKGKPVGPDSAESRQAYANFAAAAAKRYAGKKVIWEIWNEPNFAFYWKIDKGSSSAQLWSEMAKVAIPAIRAADPDAYIIGPSLSGPSQGDVFDQNVVSGNSTAWLNEVAATGALSLVDAISIHPYRDWWPETFVQQREEVRKLLTFYHVDKPLVDSEQGWGTWIFYGAHGGKGAPSDGAPTGLRNLTKDQQASYLIRNYLTNLTLNVPITVWYLWPEESINPAKGQDDGFGVLNNDGSPKQSFYAAGNLNKLLNGYSFVRRIPLGQPYDWMLEFHKGDTVTYVAWTEEGNPVRPTPRDIALPVRYAKAFDLYGNPVAGSNSEKLAITNEPQYLLDEKAAAAAPDLDPRAKITPWVDELIRNGSFEKDLPPWQFHLSKAKGSGKISTTDTHGGGKSAQLTVSSEFAPGVYGWLHQDLRLAPGKSYVVTFWAKGDNVGKAFVGAFNSRKYLPEGTFDWTEMSTEIKADAKGAFQFAYVIESPTTSLWIDDIRVEAR